MRSWVLSKLHRVRWNDYLGRTPKPSRSVLLQRRLLVPDWDGLSGSPTGRGR